MDNEFSPQLEEYFNAAEIEFQLVPHSHRTNPAELAMRTWKDHFEATLAVADPSFPLGLLRRSSVPPLLVLSGVAAQLASNVHHRHHRVAPSRRQHARRHLPAVLSARCRRSIVDHPSSRRTALHQLHTIFQPDTSAPGPSAPDTPDEQRVTAGPAANLRSALQPGAARAQMGFDEYFEQATDAREPQLPASTMPQPPQYSLEQRVPPSQQRDAAQKIGCPL